MFYPKFMQQNAQHFAVLGMLFVAGLATAGGGGGGMPWDAAITAFVNNISGPVAGGIALAAVVIAGSALIFGGEMNAFGRSMFFILLVVGVIMGAAQIIALFGAGNGALLPVQEIMPVQQL